MREIFTHREFARVGHYKSILESEGIPAFIRNEAGHNLVAELPAAVLFPTLCVENDSDYERAMEILRAVYKPEHTDATDWACAACKETVPGTFDSCWSCGAVPDEKLAASSTSEPAIACSAEPAINAPGYRDAVKALRILLVIHAVSLIGFTIAGDAIFISLPMSKQVVLDSIYPPNALSGLEMAYRYFFLTLSLLSTFLCFTLTKIGRPVFALNIVIGGVVWLGRTGNFTERWSWLFGYTDDLIIGAILAMLYLSPAAAYFRSERAASR